MSAFGILMGEVAVRVTDYFFYYFERSRARKKEDSKRGWVHHVKVELTKIFYLAQKCFRVLRADPVRVFMPVLGRN